MKKQFLLGVLGIEGLTIKPYFIAELEVNFLKNFS
jgi:hypothetical protein